MIIIYHMIFGIILCAATLGYHASEMEEKLKKDDKPYCEMRRLYVKESIAINLYSLVVVLGSATNIMEFISCPNNIGKYVALVFFETIYFILYIMVHIISIKMMRTYDKFLS